MNTKLITLLSILCVLLLGLIAGEWFYAKKLQKQTLAAIKIVDNKTYQIAQMPSIALTQKPEAGFADMVSRPLFIKGRKPVPESVDDPKSVAVTPTGPINWQLNGVYTDNNRLYALLSRTTKLPKANLIKLAKTTGKEEGNVVKRAKGEIVDGWTLVDVQIDKVKLNRSGMQKELLLRKAKPKNAVPSSEPTIDNTPKAAEEQAMEQMRQQQMQQQNNPQMQQGRPPMPGPENSPMPGTDPMQNPENQVAPEPEIIPGAEDQVMPEPEQDFQSDQPSEDTSTFENGTNEQF